MRGRSVVSKDKELQRSKRDEITKKPRSLRVKNSRSRLIRQCWNEEDSVTYLFAIKKTPKVKVELSTMNGWRRACGRLSAISFEQIESKNRKELLKFTRSSSKGLS